MPCRNMYQLVAHGTSQSPQPLNIYHSPDMTSFAATINRVVLRAIELVVHDSLQRQCNEVVKKTSSISRSALVALVPQLGKIVCSLRLRYAWGHLHGDHSILKASENIARIYFDYYMRALKKSQITADCIGPNSHGGSNHTSIDGKLILDPFPPPNSPGHFDEWLRDGYLILQQAGLAPCIPDWQVPLDPITMQQSSSNFSLQQSAHSSLRAHDPCASSYSKSKSLISQGPDPVSADIIARARV